MMKTSEKEVFHKLQRIIISSETSSHVRACFILAKLFLRMYNNSYLFNRLLSAIEPIAKQLKIDIYEEEDKIN